MSISEGSGKSKVEELKAGESSGGICRLPVPSSRFPVLLLGLLLVAASASAAGGRYEVQEIKPGVFAWVPEDIVDQWSDPQFNRAGTAGFIITSEGVVVVNTTNSPFHARELLYEIRQRTELPIRYVINTCAHGDRMLGNEVFQALQASIVSTAVAREEMRRYRQQLERRIAEDYRMEARMRGFHFTLPTEVFDAEMSLKLGDGEIRIINLGGGHSAGDAVVYLPEAKVLFLGHLFENGYFPRLASSDVRRWVEILRQVESWKVEVCVPGNGAPGGKRELADFRMFLEWLTTEVQTRIQQGQALRQMKRELLATDNFRRSARDLASRAVEALYKQLSAPGLPPE